MRARRASLGRCTGGCTKGPSHGACPRRATCRQMLRLATKIPERTLAFNVGPSLPEIRYLALCQRERESLCSPLLTCPWPILGQIYDEKSYVVEANESLTLKLDQPLSFGRCCSSVIIKSRSNDCYSLSR